jgi:ATP/maltotriose-dependent transcriptional regulator MalT
VDRPDLVSAARVATALGLDIYDYQGEAIMGGWLQRARRHLDGLETTAEHGWLALWEGHFARLTKCDLATARARAERAAEIGRDLNLKDLEMLAIALEGHTLVSEGKVDDGMKRLDEATMAALVGDISDLDAAGAACCFLMHACEQVRDLDRASQWAQRVAEFSKRWRIRPLFAICRVHYAAVEIARGEWDQAEKDLLEVLRDVGEDQGPARSEATLHLAELRRRQGRAAEARELFSEVEAFSLALIGRALLALEADDAKTATALLLRSLRRAAEDNWTVRSAALKHLARAQALEGDHDAARDALERLQALADLVRTDHVRGLARQAAGCWMAEHGEIQPAQHAFEDAVDLFENCRAPYEANRARLDLAELLDRSGHPELANAEAEIAFAAFTRLGAESEARRASAMLVRQRVTREATDSPLSKRETEVLGLVAEGLGDKEIATRLHLSEHTVHRHVSNILTKLDAPSRAAAVAQGLRRGLI